MHISVLQKEVIKYLDPKPNENFIDCTIDGGGHSSAILERNGRGRVLGIELDQEVFKNIQRKKNLILVRDNFVNLKEIIKREKFPSVSGILFDLGFSSWHIDESGRGFSFQKNELLDMRYDNQNPLTAEKILNYYSESEINRILKEFGEEQFSRDVAKQIVLERKVKPIKRTFQLVEIIKKAVPGWYQRKKIHPATRTFQALRIAVNDELANLEKALPQAEEALKPGGRLVIISFHSLEDRIVKNFLKQSNLQILNKKPITPKEEEIKLNPRSRSSKLRAAIKTL